MKEDIEKYLRDAGEKEKKVEEKTEKQESVFSPFKHVFQGFGDILGVASKKEAKGKVNMGEKGVAENLAKINANLIYSIYKKTHGMLTET